MNQNKEVIEPEQKHQAIANVEVRSPNHKDTNNRLVANVFADVVVPPNFERYPVKFHKAAVNEQPQQNQSVGPTEDDNQLITKGKAVYDKCLKVVTKMGFPEEQGQQLCQLLTETMILTEQEEQEQNQQSNQPNNSQQGNPAGNSTENRPPPSGFVGATKITSCQLQKDLARKQATIDTMNNQLNEYRTRVARVASLENEATDLREKIKEQDLEKYLIRYYHDPMVRNWKAKSYNRMGLSIEDLQDIYEDIPARRTASVQQQQQTPKSKVRLRTASTDEYNNSNRFNNIRETNEKLTNAFFGINSNNNLYDDYIA